MAGVRHRLFRLASIRPLQALIVSAAVGATAAMATPAPPRAATSGLAQVVEEAMGYPARLSQPARTIWDGADLDGDGQADFANPTGGEERGHDAYGSGAFGASRDGGARRHEGADFVAKAGQSVAAPISGYVTRIGHAYADAPELRYVEITNPALGLQARVFYVDPAVSVGQTVALGRPIGEVRSLQRLYPGGMTDHVHLELRDARGATLDPSRVLTARLETRAWGD